MQSSDRVVWYRYEDRLSGDDWGTYVNVNLRQFEVVRETPKGVWLRLYEYSDMSPLRFVLRESRKRYACPTKEQAMESFLARKRKQMRILKQKLQHVEEAIQIAEGKALLLV